MLRHGPGTHKQDGTSLTKAFSARSRCLTSLHINRLYSPNRNTPRRGFASLRNGPNSYVLPVLGMRRQGVDAC